MGPSRPWSGSPRACRSVSPRPRIERSSTCSSSCRVSDRALRQRSPPRRWSGASPRRTCTWRSCAASGQVRPAASRSRTPRTESAPPRRRACGCWRSRTPTTRRGPTRWPRRKTCSTRCTTSPPSGHSDRSSRGIAALFICTLPPLMTSQRLSDNEFLFTSESVTEGHPDKMADQVSDGVLDAVMAEDPQGRVACETLVNTGLILVSGEITTKTYVDIPRIARQTAERIGYTDARSGFDCRTCSVITAIDEQSPDIAQGVDVAYEARHDPSDEDPLDVMGAGDQGMMFGYATRETRELMPMPILLAHRLAQRLAEVRRGDVMPYLRPDGKTQVTVRYENNRPIEIERVLISTQHKPGIDSETLIKPDLFEHVLHPVLPAELYDPKKLLDDTGRNFLVNPTGRFELGGPFGGLRSPLRGQERGGRGVGRTLRATGGVRDRGRASGVGDGRDVRHREDRPLEDRRAHRRAFRPAPRRFPPVPEPAPADLPEDRGLRPLRPRGPRLHLGEDRQGRSPPRGRGP